MKAWKRNKTEASIVEKGRRRGQESTSEIVYFGHFR
jgi:hypothetical protein